MQRKPPRMIEKLASALLELKCINNDGHLVPIIDRQAAKQMTAEQIVAQFELDHWPVPVAFGGSNHPTNLHWKTKMQHREKTAKIDIPAIAKSKRLSKSHADHKSVMDGVTVEKKKRSLPMPGTKASGLKKKLNGSVERR
jgi:hypothetical protein